MTPEQAQQRFLKLQRRINKAVAEMDAVRAEFNHLKYGKMVDGMYNGVLTAEWKMMCKQCLANEHSDFDDWTC